MTEFDPDKVEWPQEGFAHPAYEHKMPPGSDHPANVAMYYDDPPLVVPAEVLRRAAEKIEKIEKAADELAGAIEEWMPRSDRANAALSNYLKVKGSGERGADAHPEDVPNPGSDPDQSLREAAERVVDGLTSYAAQFLLDGEVTRFMYSQAEELQAGLDKDADGGGAADAAGVADADLDGLEVHINGSSDLSPDEAKILGDAMKRAYVLMKERQGMEDQ